VLDSLKELFYFKFMGNVHSVAVAYEKTFLCQIINNSPMVISDTVLFLNIADIMQTSTRTGKAHGPNELEEQGKGVFLADLRHMDDNSLRLLVSKTHSLPFY
jgi:hypothetical protein